MDNGESPSSPRTITESTPDIMGDDANATLAYDYFRTTWCDFYRWEQEHYASILETLRSQVPLPTSKATPSLLPQWMQPNPSRSSLRSSLPETDVVESFNNLDEIETMKCMPSASSAPRRTDVNAFIVSVTLGAMPANLSPCPQYESCTPLSQNASLGDDSPIMPYIPFADDPEFDWIAHCSKYQSLAWQDYMKDPNLEVIVIETSARLCNEHDLTTEDLEETGLLPFQLLGTHQSRDLPPWHMSQTFQLHKPNTTSPLVAMKYLVKTFCSICSIGYCFSQCKCFRGISGHSD
ncbi:hypothetical protein AX15_002288 [Amanita polypyramis BW_CC]|nr:hypothetical protein AX15_002288 [Amanita polypyramis BW_CC]